uniref:Transcription initiation factor TFIID subunit 12 n=1 Tax=Strigamia maritima TaxID=126957 RepID=T1IY49_STRMM
MAATIPSTVVGQPSASIPGVVSTVPTSNINLKTVLQPVIMSPMSSDTSQVLNKQRLQDLVREIDVNEQLDDDVEEMLLQIADDFIENVVTNSCLLAKHRKANTLEVKDVQLNLEKNWNIWIPGFGSDELRPYKKSTATEAHKQVTDNIDYKCVFCIL